MNQGLIEKTIQKLDKRINNIDKSIDMLKQDIINLDIKQEKDLSTHKSKLINEVLDNYDFPATQEISILYDKQYKINTIITKKQSNINKCNKMRDDLISELETLFAKKQELNEFIDEYEVSIREATNQTNIMKESQVNNLFETRFDNMKIKLNKLQQRRQYQIQNNNYMARKKIIKAHMRRIDKDIKTIYWKIVQIEVSKNNALKELSNKFQYDRKNSADTINKELYKHLNIPINKIINQDIYFKFKNDVKTINNNIESQYNIKRLKRQLNQSLSEYKVMVKKYNDVDEGKVNILDIASVYNKYKNIKIKMEKIDQNINDIDINYKILEAEISKHNNDIKKDVKEKGHITKQIDKYREHNMKILESKIMVKMERYTIRANIKQRNEIAKLHVQIKTHENEKGKIEQDIISLNKTINETHA